MKIGFSELIIIFVVALIVIGPDKLPEYAKKLGESLKAFRNVSNDLTKDIRESVIEPLEEAQKPIKEAMQPVTEVADEIKKNIDDVKKSVNDIGKPSSVKPETKAESATADVEKADEKAEDKESAVTDDEKADEKTEEKVPGTASADAEKTEENDVQSGASEIDVEETSEQTDSGSSEASQQI